MSYQSCGSIGRFDDLRRIPHARSSSLIYPRGKKRSVNEQFNQLRTEVSTSSKRARLAGSLSVRTLNRAEASPPDCSKYLTGGQRHWLQSEYARTPFYPCRDSGSTGLHSAGYSLMDHRSCLAQEIPVQDNLAGHYAAWARRPQCSTSEQVLASQSSDLRLSVSSAPHNRSHQYRGLVNIGRNRNTSPSILDFDVDSCNQMNRDSTEESESTDADEYYAFSTPMYSAGQLYDDSFTEDESMVMSSSSPLNDHSSAPCSAGTKASSETMHNFASQRTTSSESILSHSDGFSLGTTLPEQTSSLTPSEQRPYYQYFTDEAERRGRGTTAFRANNVQIPAYIDFSKSPPHTDTGLNN